MKLIKCIFCSKPTTLHYINAQKKIGGKVVTLTNTPVYYCKPCNETFLSKEAQDVFNFIRDRALHEKALLFNYDDLSRKVNS